jgi:hypothetical protein
MKLRLEPQLISHTMGLASSADDAMVLFYECPDKIQAVLCVNLPHARICGDLEAARAFFNEAEIANHEMKR